MNTLIKRKPLTSDPYDALFQGITPFFLGSGSGRRYWESDIGFEPNADIIQRDNCFVVRLELPGMNKEDISVHVENNNLVIEGEKRIEHEEEKDKVHLKECSYGKFRRAYSLKNHFDSDNIESKLENGILSIKVPLKNKDDTIKRIAIK